MAVPLATIATAAKVSPKTVANVLNPKYRHLYSPQTVQRILTLAADLGYQPNGSARSLVSRRFAAIGLLLSTSTQLSNLPLPLLHGIEEALHAADLHLMVAALPDERLRDPSTLPKVLRELLVDGLLVDYNTAVPEVLARQVDSAERPAVWLNAPLVQDCVRPDDFSAARDLTIALLASGHRRLAYLDEVFHRISGQRHYSKDHRLAGFRAACPDGLVLLDDQPSALHERLRTLMRRPDRPTAVVCYGGETLYVIEAAARAGLELPRDLLISGFVGHGLADPGPYGIAYAEVPEYAIGREAVALLRRRLEDPAYHAAELLLPFRLPPAELLPPPR